MEIMVGEREGVGGGWRALRMNMRSLEQSPKRKQQVKQDCWSLSQSVTKTMEVVIHVFH